MLGLERWSAGHLSPLGSEEKKCGGSVKMKKKKKRKKEREINGLCNSSKMSTDVGWLAGWLDFQILMLSLTPKMLVNNQKLCKVRLKKKRKKERKLMEMDKLITGPVEIKSDKRTEGQFLKNLL